MVVEFNLINRDFYPFATADSLAYRPDMKTLTIGEAARNLANWLKQAIAGEKIDIRSDDTVVAAEASPFKRIPKPFSPREALRRLQSETHLSPAQAESYLREVHAERLAAKKRSA